MANEDKKILMPCYTIARICLNFRTITDQKSIEKYGGSRMYFAPSQSIMTR